MLFLVAASSLLAQPAKDDDALRSRVLALNNVTGDDPIRGEIRSLSEKSNAAETKKLIAVGVKMAKEKDQPLNYNGAFILASVAFGVPDLDASEVLYQVCADQAAKLQSLHKLVQAYGGIIAVIEQFYLDKKYEKSTKLSQKFIETLERQGVKREFKERVLRHMIQSMFKQGEVDKANRMVDNLLKEHGNEWQNLKLKAWVEHEKGRVDESIKTYKDVLARIAQDSTLAPDDKTHEQTQVYISIVTTIEQLYLDKKYEQSQKLSQELLDLLEKQSVSQALKETVMRQIVQSMVRRGLNDQAKQMVDKLLKQGGTDWRNLKLKAWLANEMGQYDEAAKVYEDSLRRVELDSTLEPVERRMEQVRIRYILSGVYIELDRVDKAADQLNTLLLQDPNNPTFNNDLGYIWADNDKNLEQAEKMIRKALDEDRKQRKEDTSLKAEDDKDNPAYLDSMGWVLFKKKKYQEAKTYLIRASQDKDGQHIEILDHLGDTHLILGEKADAVAAWKKALQIKPATKREEQKKATVEKKLKANQ
jgi:tetratricopeptide (TPR) repeat protein